MRTPPPTIHDAAAAEILERLAGLHAGLRLGGHATPRHLSWLRRRMAQLGLDAPGDYADRLARQDAAGLAERELLTRQVTTGETYFFRDPGQFELIARHVLPELIARRADRRRLRLWSAGCSTGEEAYSLAMVLLESAPRLAGWDLRVLGTDINTDALDRARAGVYGEWSFRGMDKGRMARHFHPEGDQWRIGPNLRQAVRFRQLDLVHGQAPDTDPDLDDVDLILCRNVFIYMTPEATAQVSARLSRILADGGYLVTGHGELLGHNTPGLQARVFPQAVLLHKSGEAASPPGWPERPGAVRASAPSERPRADAARGSAPRKPFAPSGAEPERLPLDAAWRLANQGRAREALAACERAVACSPLDPRPYYLMAQLAQERGATEEARTLLAKVIYLDPDHIAAHLELAGLMLQAGQAGRGRRQLETARRLLAALPPQAAVPPYAHSSAADVLAFAERLLSGMAEFARPADPGAGGDT